MQACSPFPPYLFTFTVAVYLSVKQFVCCRTLDMVGSQWLGEDEVSISACDWKEQRTVALEARHCAGAMHPE